MCGRANFTRRHGGYYDCLINVPQSMLRIGQNMLQITHASTHAHAHTMVRDGWGGQKKRDI